MTLCKYGGLMSDKVFGVKEAHVTYSLREGVYGICRNENNEVLVVKVDHTHFLVGGGIEVGEDHETALKREFIEEIGYGIKVSKYLTSCCEYHKSKKDGVDFQLQGHVYLVELGCEMETKSEMNHEMTWLSPEDIGGSMQLDYQAYVLDMYIDHMKVKEQYMMNRKMYDEKTVQKQYKNDDGLNIRKNLHRNYSVNKQGFGAWLFNQYTFEQGFKVLELGSGNGDMWEKHMDDLSSRVDFTLSDFSQGMVDLLTSKYEGHPVEVKQINIQAIPFEDEQFDMVIANAMLYHVPDVNLALGEVRRILKPGGKFYASTFGENGLSQYINTTLIDLKISEGNKVNNVFTLQNGCGQLSQHFTNVNRLDYDDKWSPVHRFM